MKIDDYVKAYVREITDGLDAEAMIADRHEWTGEDSDDGPGAYWHFAPTTPPTAPSWPEGVTVIWDWSAGWIDHNRTPLPISTLATVPDVTEAIREHVAALPTTTSTDGPQWHQAAQLEDLLTEYAKDE
ncbi:hypothetical protein [Nonomuraea basaltis]|uniref:hypothetical protein n=1 Tax=Nonomuraea basaltis TaxID=2495887 RepID=UPI00110C3F7E|nr:hypothetical protein [Nonomuraea basaltis]TMR95787.1 hypothetical protein EJK15_27060 [Nonomuraea basaltis]